MKTIKVKDLMAISGKGGLHRYLAQGRNGVIVESLEDKKRSVVPPTARVSSLEDISIFTEEEDVSIADVFFRMHEKLEGKEAMKAKSDPSDLKSFFAEVLPEYDEDRVYVSDIKKVIGWYNLLHKLGLLEIIEKEEEEDVDTPEETEDKQDQK